MRLALALLALTALPAAAQVPVATDLAAGVSADLHGQTDGSAPVSSVSPGVRAMATLTPDGLGRRFRVAVGGVLALPADGARAVSSAEARIELTPSGAPNGMYLAAGPALVSVAAVGDPDDLDCFGCAEAYSGRGAVGAIGKRFGVGRTFVSVELGGVVFGDAGGDAVGRISLVYGRRLR